MSNPCASSDSHQANAILAALERERIDDEQPQCYRTKNLRRPTLASDFG